MFFEAVVVVGHVGKTFPLAPIGQFGTPKGQHLIGGAVSVNLVDVLVDVNVLVDPVYLVYNLSNMPPKTLSSFPEI